MHVLSANTTVCALAVSQTVATGSTWSAAPDCKAFLQSVLTARLPVAFILQGVANDMVTGQSGPLSHIDLGARVQALNNLLQSHKVAVFKQGTQLLYKAAAPQDNRSVPLHVCLCAVLCCVLTWCGKSAPKEQAWKPGQGVGRADALLAAACRMADGSLAFGTGEIARLTSRGGAAQC